MNFFTSLYYSTLGNDCDLIDYLTYIDDSFIQGIFRDDESIKSNIGRPGHSTLTLFRMHYLYFIKPEFYSFRQMCEEMKKPKHQDYRAFIEVPNTSEVPSHAALSRFRKAIGLTDKMADEIKGKLKSAADFHCVLDTIAANILSQCMQSDDFLNPNLASLDSRPINARVGGFKNACACNTKPCTCPPRFKDPDAKVGRQRTKVNENRFFIGYRKNTVIMASSQGPVPVASIVVDASSGDQTNLMPIIKQAKKLGAELPVVAADMGYIGGEDKVSAAQMGTIVHTEIKGNMIPPDEFCGSRGELECPEGYKMDVLDYCSKTLQICAGIQDESHCRGCLRDAVCDHEFMLDLAQHPHYYNPIPQQSQLQDHLINFRKQSELNFAIESNLLDRKMMHDKLPVKKLAAVDTYLRLADICMMISKMIKHCRAKYRDAEYFINLKQKNKQMIYQQRYIAVA